MGKRESLQDMVVVDLDVHVNDTPTELAPYMDMPWRKSLEHLKNVPWRYLSIPGYSPNFAENIPLWPGGNDRMNVDSPAQMKKELSAIHVDIAILFPDHLLGIPVLPQKEYAAALARAYNAWILDKWCDKEEGLKGLIMVAPQDPEDGAREIEKYKNEEGIVGVYLPCTGLDTLWGHVKYDPIFAAAESAGLPVLLHAATTLVPHFPFNLHQYETFFAQHSFVHSFSMMANMLKMIETGVPVRFPNIKICFTESGVSWVPFIMMRLDKEYVENRRDIPFLEHPPSYYVKKFFYATQPIEEPDNPKHLVQLIEMFEGETQTMFASDWPHHDFDHPREVFNLPFSEEVRRNIMGENALRFFDIDSVGRRNKFKIETNTTK
ncbi:amidohydrolase [Peribacillus cavernae]|uniref:Amidohydrolase n=1 Tax=Peribacillus cavernae TaxID=1674310 RepID=A0A3S1B2G0_9BACI|nr:amidohydrolase family protein [Peribacillus cavernae]MDQ0219414.1 putative TIM-barrel fold metal-dependent hydrolase [Peribacillus cavernae]RUQ27157.1 amidohydrolase [Peribacillus cavernae]